MRPVVRMSAPVTHFLLILGMAVGALAIASCDGASSEQTASSDDRIVITCETSDQGQMAIEAQRLLGLSLADAKAAVAGSGCEMRVVSTGGKPRDLRGSLQSNRINVAIEDGRVVQVIGLG